MAVREIPSTDEKDIAMSITVEDYQRALEGFLEDMRRLGDKVVSVLLYGSMARGDIRPGQSDLMDAYVFLKEGVFEDKGDFLKTVEVMIGTCEKLVQSGLPFHHPFHYYGMDEVKRLPAVFLPTLRSDRSSCVILGEDIRPQMEASCAGHLVARTSFFEVRRIFCLPLSRYLHKIPLTEQDRGEISARLTYTRKYVPLSACFALGIQVEESEAVAVLRRVTDVDTDVIEQIESLQGHMDRKPDKEIREILRKALEFVEALHEEICLQIQNKRG
jgi:predicted nucleotidyltransferase